MLTKTFWVAKVLFKKIGFKQKVRVEGKTALRKMKIWGNYFANFEKCENNILAILKNCFLKLQ